MKSEWDKVWENYKKPSKAEDWLIGERHKIIIKLLKGLGKNLEKMKTLEIGCGFASNSRLLKKGGIQVYCIDKSKTIIKKIKKDIENSFVGDASNLPFKDNFFDLVFSAGLLEHFGNPDGIIKEMFRVVKKEGIIINFVPGKYSLWQLYRILRGKNWVGYEESYTHKKLGRKMRNALHNKEYELIEFGGIDPFSIRGIILKTIGINVPVFRINKDAYTEIYQAYKKSGEIK